MAHQNEFYKYFNLAHVPKDYKKRQEISNLFKPPKEEPKKLMPHFYNFLENDTHQIDSLYLPEDHGFKYCIVVADLATSTMDAEPMKDLSSENVLNAVLRIYRRGIVKTPNRLITDSGAEYAGSFAAYFRRHRIKQKVAITGRHRQVAMVEHKNQLLGTVLHMQMYAHELLTGEINREWVGQLRDVVDKINERYSHPPLTDEQLDARFGDPWMQKQKIIPLGTSVRIALEEPRDVTNAKLHGTFRKTDPRWTTIQYKVEDYIMEPHEPMMYILDKPTKPNQRVAYTAQRLQVVKTNEEEPPASVIRGQPKTYVVKELVDKRRRKGIIQYLVRWKGYPQEKDFTWEPQEDIPAIAIRSYERAHA